MRKYILAALLAGTIATPAFAQEAGTFSGFRVEGIVGYDSLRAGDTDTSDEDSESVNGLAYGVGAGFDFDLGSVVAGIEAEYADTTGSREVTEDGETARLETGRDIYVGGRIGVRAGPSTLVYAKAGYTNLTLKGTISDATTSLDLKGTTDGWRLGAGVEQMFGPNAFAKLEYRYSNYGDFQIDDAPENVDLDINRHQLVAGFGFRF